jgi:hypothetical protein
LALGFPSSQSSLLAISFKAFFFFAITVLSVRCAIYTRKSTEYGLELEFNSLDAQREACEAYIKSQTHEGWQAVSQRSR